MAKKKTTSVNNTPFFLLLLPLCNLLRVSLIQPWEVGGPSGFEQLQKLQSLGSCSSLNLGGGRSVERGLGGHKKDC